MYGDSICLSKKLIIFLELSRFILNFIWKIKHARITKPLLQHTKSPYNVQID